MASRDVKVTRVLQSAATPDGRMAILRMRNERNEELRLFFEPNLILPTLLALQGSAVAASTQRKEQASREVLRGIQIADTRLESGQTQTGEHRLGLRFVLMSGIEGFLPLEKEHLERLVAAGAEALAGLDHRGDTQVQ